MAVDRVSKSIGYTVNMGNFESMKFEVGIETDVRDKEKPWDALARASAVLEAELGNDVKKAMERRG